MKSIVPEISIKSNISQLESFQNNVVWQDLKNHLLELIEGLRNELEHADSIEDIKELQGGIKTARSLLSAPEGLIEELKIKQEQESQ